MILPFIDEISGLAMIILLDLNTGYTNTVKVKFIRSTRFLDVTYHSSETLICSKDKTLGVAHLRSVGYYKVKQSSIQHCLQHYYEFKPLQMLFEEFNLLTNILREKNNNPLILVLG